MKYTYKNAKENKLGSIDCEILLSGEWVPHTQDPLNKYDLSEESDWPDIKPCDQAEKTAYEAQQEQDLINQEAIAYLTKTDWYILRAMDSGGIVPDEIKLARAEARERILI
tara:strand:- start:2516 stop:2848 length:333 start_codon:yes stop_codon:yes gene_type:complete